MFIHEADKCFNSIAQHFTLFPCSFVRYKLAVKLSSNLFRRPPTLSRFLASVREIFAQLVSLVFLKTANEFTVFFGESWSIFMVTSSGFCGNPSIWNLGT